MLSYVAYIHTYITAPKPLLQPRYTSGIITVLFLYWIRRISVEFCPFPLDDYRGVTEFPNTVSYIC